MVLLFTDSKFLGNVTPANSQENLYDNPKMNRKWMKKKYKIRLSRLNIVEDDYLDASRSYQFQPHPFPFLGVVKIRYASIPHPRKLGSDVHKFVPKIWKKGFTILVRICFK